MIYTVIAFLGENRIEAKRDCRVFRQPLSLLPVEVKEYIEKTKNESVRAERELAYTTLLCSLKAFFDIEQPVIDRTAEGKPFIKDSQIHINLSHSDGAVAVCLSDEGEVGVDLQSEIDPERAERLENRFFPDFKPMSENINVNYYFLCIEDGEAVFEELFPSLPDGCFTAKWTAAESLMKLYGKGFADSSALPLLSEKSKTEMKSITLGKVFYLATSVTK